MRSPLSGFGPSSALHHPRQRLMHAIHDPAAAAATGEGGSMRRDFDTHPKPCDFQSSDKFPRTVSRTKSFQRLRVLNPSGKPGPVYIPRCPVSTLHSPGRYITPYSCPFTLHTCPIHYTPLHSILRYSQIRPRRGIDRIVVRESSSSGRRNGHGGSLPVES